MVGNNISTKSTIDATIPNTGIGIKLAKINNNHHALCPASCSLRTDNDNTGITVAKTYNKNSISTMKTINYNNLSARQTERKNKTSIII